MKNPPQDSSSRKSRRGRAVKKGKNFPAEFKPLSDAPAPDSQGGLPSAPPPKPPFDPAPILKDLGIYWLQGSSNYFIRRNEEDRERFIQIGSSELRRKLVGKGVSKRGEYDSLSSVDKVLDAATESAAVDYALNLAGHRANVYQSQGSTILVKESPRIISPMEGDCKLIHKFCLSLLGRKQQDIFYAWLKVAFCALHSGERRSGQCLIIIGPSGSGKSRLQHNLITPLLGGRSADPKSFFFGRTDFNSEMIGSEHLLIEEIPSSNEKADRVYFGEKIKEVVANDTTRLHGKQKDAVTVCPFWRLTITLNNEPEKMRSLPPMTSDITEKLIILEAGKAEDFWKEFDQLPDPRRAFREAIERELPSFAHELLEWKVPTALNSGPDGRRYGVRSFMPEALAQEFMEGEPEFALLRLIDRELWKDEENPADWEGEAEDLKKKLTDADSSLRSSAVRLCSSTVTLGIYLNKLEKAYPERVKKLKRSAYKRPWKIIPPKKV